MCFGIDVEYIDTTRHMAYTPSGVSQPIKVAMQWISYCTLWLLVNKFEFEYLPQAIKKYA